MAKEPDSVLAMFKGLSPTEVGQLNARVLELFKQARDEIKNGEKPKGDNKMLDDNDNDANIGQLESDIFSMLPKNLTPEEIQQVTSDLRQVVEGARQRRTQAEQAGLRARYEAELKKVAASAPNHETRVRLISELKARWRERGLRVY